MGGGAGHTVQGLVSRPRCAHGGGHGPQTGRTLGVWGGRRAGAQEDLVSSGQWGEQAYSGGDAAPGAGVSGGLTASLLCPAGLAGHGLGPRHRAV